MKKILLALSLVALATVTYSFTKLPATPINFDASYSGGYTLPNTCSGELVDLTYTGEFSVRGVVNGNRVNISYHTNEKYDGVGQTSGNGYSGHISEKETMNYSMTNGQLVLDIAAHGVLATAGGGNNIKFTQTFHVTVNANGDVSVIRGDFTYDCQ